MKRALNATRALLLAAAVLPWGGCAKAPEHKPLIGILMFADYQDAIVEGLINGLEEFGYEAGKNIEYRILNAQAYRAALPKLAGELAALRPAALCPVGGPETRACIDAAANAGIPVIFAGVNSPIERGLARTLLEPLPNTTGVRTASAELMPKRMWWITVFLPKVKTVTVLYEPASVSSAKGLKLCEETAAGLGLRVKAVPLSTAEEVSALFDSLNAADHEALLSTPGPLLLSTRKEIIAPAAIRERVPFFCEDKQAAEACALQAYGPDLCELGRQAARLVCKVLMGARPESMPIETPAHTLLCVNMKVAREIKVSFPPRVLRLADCVLFREE